MASAVDRQARMRARAPKLDEKGAVLSPPEAPKTADGAKVKKKSKASPVPRKRAKKVVADDALPVAGEKTALEPQSSPSRLIIDAVSGEILGPDKSLDLAKSGRKHYSHSFIENLAKCSAKSYFRSIHAEVPKIFALERGSCLHQLIEDFGKKGLDPLENFDNQWNLFIRDNLDKMSVKDQEKADKGYSESRLMIEEFLMENRELFKTNVRPEDNEVEFTIPITIKMGGREFTRDFYGKIDLVCWNKDRTAARVIDYKSSASAPDTSELARNTQFALYEQAFYHLFPGKKLLGLEYYLLRGAHGCKNEETGESIKFSSKAHPRDPLKRIDGCWINYAVKVPKKTPEHMQMLYNTYYGPKILQWEAGLIAKDGLADPRNRCSMCEYAEVCDKTTEFPAPTII